MDDFFEEMRKLQSEIDRMFGGYYRKKGGDVKEPLVDILDKEDKLIVTVELPGVSKEDIQVSVSDNALTIEAAAKTTKTEKQEGYYFQERGYSTFYRTIPLPCEVEESRISAKYNNGILEVVLPKKKKTEKKGSRITIE